ncbi:MAG: hypothetical protein RLZ98_3144 [Pseudomonadota bacterium]|jgi:L,D-peptidoglycan transpeptidase YkuD (ErfK/YbiS/YcfS/YnhG family)
MSVSGGDPDLVVRRVSPCSIRGVIELGALRFPCALGRGGSAARKREGDGATPRGRFSIERVFYRADRCNRPKTGLPVKQINFDDGWCDAAGDRNYNRQVKLPYAARSEVLWREDVLYDIVVVLGYNLRPRSQGRGSAIFMHVARQDYSPTEGCIALRAGHLIRVLERLRPGAHVRVT